MEKITVTENEGCDNGGQEWKSRPPPFLKKIFEMVDDTETNSIISWNSCGTGFIIWDHNKFSAELLPRHFKTSNFSSFVYQLHSYGFRKMSWERYEYANPWFQAAKKHWLSNIKRKNQQSHLPRKRCGSTPDQDSTNATVEGKLYAIMTEQNDMKCTLQKLKQSLDNMENQLTNLETNIRQEFKDEKVNVAVFLEQFMQNLRKKKDKASGDSTKRPRLDEVPNTKICSSAAADDSGSSTQDQKANKTTENTEDCRFWKNLLEDDEGLDSNGGQGDLAAHHSKAIMELDVMMESSITMEREILIAEPSDPDVEDDGHLGLWT